VTFLYNCRDAGDQYRITKFDEDLNPLHFYYTTLSECNCPAGHHETCRHRQMLARFLERGYVNQPFFWDHERGGWVNTAVDEDLIPGRIRDPDPLRQLRNIPAPPPIAEPPKPITLGKPLNIRRRI
jgi:hypothetical protein